MENNSSAGFKSILGQQFYREFLNSYISYRKKTGLYSLTRFAREIGFRSSNYASLILSGKRNLAVKDGLKIAKLLSMTEIETQYFMMLIQHNDAEDTTQKKFFKQWLNSISAKNPKARLVLKPADTPQLLAEWFIPALLACLHVDRGTSVGQMISLTGLQKKEIVPVMVELVARRLVHQKEELYYLMSSGVMDAQYGKHFQFKNFQKIQLDRALAILNRNSDRDAKFASNIYLLSKDSLQDLKVKIRDLLVSVDVDSEVEMSDQLVQLNIQLFDFKSGVFHKK